MGVGMLCSEENTAKIIREISEIESQYQRMQGLILTESDLQCLLYSKLYGIFSEERDTMDRGIKAIALHGEISWYDDSGRLRIRPDITIFNPSGLTIKHGVSFQVKGNRYAYGNLPRKGCEFCGGAIIIETKFVRKKNGITMTDIRKFEKDIEKILNILSRLKNSSSGEDLFGIFVVFNKTNKGKRLVDRLYGEYRSEPRLRLFYGTGNVEF